MDNSTEDPALAALTARVAQLETDLAAAQAEITTLQGAMTGLSAAATVNDDANPIDWSQLKSVPDIIYCRYDNVNDNTQVLNGNVRYWNPAECGGVLPDDTYIAALSEVEIAGAEDNFRAFTDDGSGMPGVYWFSFNPGIGMRISALYVPIVNVP